MLINEKNENVKMVEFSSVW